MGLRLNKFFFYEGWTDMSHGRS